MDFRSYVSLAVRKIDWDVKWFIHSKHNKICGNYIYSKPNDFLLFLCCAGKREQEEGDTGQWHGGDA